MITCEFKTNGESENLELSESVWEAIRSWIEFEKKEVLLCRWLDKEGYHVAISAESKLRVSFLVKFDPDVKDAENYELEVHLEDEVKKILIPSDVSVRVYKEKMNSEEETEVNSDI